MMLFKNIKMSIRRLKNNRLHAFLGVLGFSAGFTMCLAIGLYIYGEYTVDTYPENHKRIFRVFNAKTNSSDIDYNVNEFLKNKFASIENTCPIYINSKWEVDVYTKEKSIYIKEGLIATTNDVFDMLSMPIIKSVSDTPFIDKNSSIITESVSKKIFGNANPLGKAFKINSFETVISAVIKDFPNNSSISGGILLNAENPEFRLNMSFVNGEIITLTNVYLLLKQNQSQKELVNVINNSIGNHIKTVPEISLQPIQDIYFNTQIKDNNRHGNKSLITILSIIGILILLLSVINYVNYIMSLQLKRIKEIGIRKVNGATRINIVINYLIDVCLWVFISFMISLILLKILVPYFNQLFQEQLDFQALSVPTFIISIVLILAVVILISSLPIIILLIRFDIQSFLKNKAHTNTNTISRSLLPVFQLLIAMLLIVGAIVIQNQIFYAKHINLGFNDNELLHIDVPYKALDPVLFKEELLKNPSIQDVSLSGGIPGNLSSSMKNPDWNYTLYQMDIDEYFLNTMQITLLKGRNVSKNDSKQCIVNEATLKVLEIKNFEKERIKYMDDDLEIVGVVKDFHFGSIHEKIEPLIMKYSINRAVSLRINKTNISKTMTYINKTWKSMVSGTPIKYEFYNTSFDAMYRKEERLANACTLFSIIAIIITCLGLFGQIIFLTDKKTKEIGIRKVNGATIKEIMMMLNKGFIKWVGIAFVIACPIAYYAMSKWLENFAYKTNLSWWVFALAGIFTLIIALLTVSWQTYSAATRNPVESLRDE
ncbi:ABC transporter permease [Thalassobellus citreus]|uniref:ABC transporter permease n=1 Tax=Thalassobellus citreus TaxID=3367752 RepID=UPI003796B841